MDVDPYLIGTAIFGPAAAVLGLAWLSARRSAEIAWETFDALHLRYERQADDMLRLEARLAHFEREEAERIEHLRKISVKGIAASKAAAARRREEAKAKTLTAVAETSFRSRPQVVAPVKARRTRARKSVGAIA